MSIMRLASIPRDSNLKAWFIYVLFVAIFIALWISSIEGDFIFMKRTLNFKESILYVCRLQFGNLESLKRAIGPSNVVVMKNAGFIAYGRKPTSFKPQTTWKVTQAAKDYYRATYGRMF